MGTTEPDLALRKATPEDCRFYWEVNNAPSTRALSVSSDPIPWENHERWYATRLDASTTELFVAESGGERVGVVRFDQEGADATISVALAPAHQGKGLGRRIIAAGTRSTLAADAVERVIALIRPDNVGSIRAFEAAGYIQVGATEAAGVGLARYEATA